MPGLKLAFCLFAYRPWGGLQRDFFRIACECVRRGHQLQVYTMEWHGELPSEFAVEVIPVSRLRQNAGRSRAFGAAVQARLQARAFDVVVGFNRLPGLDIYYAADPCYAARIARLRGAWYRWTARYRQFSAVERTVFAPPARTRILMLVESEIDNFVRYYQTPRERFHLLPPGIDPARRAPPNAPAQRLSTRVRCGITTDELLILMVGSGFRTKGLDRAIRAVAALPQPLRQRTRLLVAGRDKQAPFERLARRLGIAPQLTFLGARDDVGQLMLAADLLIHPAYSENTGTVLLEALVAGLPVLATDACGFAFHVERAAAGCILHGPFAQYRLDVLLREMLCSPERPRWQANGIRYGQQQDLYSMPQRAADLIEQFTHAS